MLHTTHIIQLCSSTQTTGKEFHKGGIFITVMVLGLFNARILSSE